MRAYWLLLFAVLMLVVGVQGLALDFQNPSDFSAQVSGQSTACSAVPSWTHNTNGGNSYIYTSMATNNFEGAAAERSFIISQTALPMTYSAATFVSGGGAYNSVMLYDSAYTLMGSITSDTVVAGSRLEMKMIGGDAYLYDDGVEVGHTTLTQNPTYVGWGKYRGYSTCGWLGCGGPCGPQSGNFDDVIWGSTGSKYIFGMPENGYVLIKDILNPAAGGFYRVNQTVANGSPTLISSTTFTSTFGKASGTNETVCLEDWGGACYQTYYTGTSYAGAPAWNLTTFFASTAPYGLYVTTIQTQVPSTSPYVNSDRIPYIGAGATINFDKNSYAVGETATLTVEMTPTYYAAVTSPHVVIQDIYGTEVYNAPITLALSGTNRIGTATYTWTSDEDEGVYYGLIYATYLGEEILMNYDTADLNGVLVVNGYVFNAETAGTITGATVNITQGVTTDSVLTATDGNYTSTSAFVANAPTTLVASKTGYETYQHVFTPLYAGAIQINLTLMPTNPAHTGIALGGIVRTPPYNRTINAATVVIQNSSAPFGNYTVTTNSVGYYIKNGMPNNYWWDIWGSKIGFSNSTIYQKLVVGI